MRPSTKTKLGHIAFHIPALVVILFHVLFSTDYLRNQKLGVLLMFAGFYALGVLMNLVQLKERCGWKLPLALLLVGFFYALPLQKFGRLEDNVWLFTGIGIAYFFLLPFAGNIMHRNALGWSRGLALASRSLCKQCSYDLTGNESGVCPECGVPI